MDLCRKRRRMWLAPAAALSGLFCKNHRCTLLPCLPMLLLMAPVIGSILDHVLGLVPDLVAGRFSSLALGPLLGLVPKTLVTNPLQPAAPAAPKLCTPFPNPYPLQVAAISPATFAEALLTYDHRVNLRPPPFICGGNRLTGCSYSPPPRLRGHSY